MLRSPHPFIFLGGIAVDNEEIFFVWFQMLLTWLVRVGIRGIRVRIEDRVRDRDIKIKTLI